MTQLNEISVALAGLAVLWAMYYFLFKQQRLDLYREELFALRDELFDLANGGELSFDHRAYTELRFLLNGMLRFAHRANLLGLGIAIIRSRMRNQPTENFSRWRRSVSELPRPVQNKLFGVHERMFRSFARHLVTGSIALPVFFAPMFAWKTLRLLRHRIFTANPKRNSFRALFDRAAIKMADRAHARAFEEDAYFSEREARTWA
jgi:hypothetical protein